MRDPARIDRIIGKLRATWHEHPDLRFGQLLVNAGLVEMEIHSGPGYGLVTAKDPFYVEDDVIEARLDEYFQSNG